MKKTAFLLLIPFMLAAFSRLSAEDASLARGAGSGGESVRPVFTLSLSPFVDFPLGESSTLFTIGGGSELNGELYFSALPFVFMKAGFGYAFVPMQYLTSVSMITGYAGGGLRWEATPWLSLNAYVAGGAYYGFLNNPLEMGSGVYPYLSAGAGLSFKLLPSLSLGVCGYYRNGFGLYEGAGAGVSVTYQIGGRQQPMVRFIETKFADVYSIFYKYYDDHPLGTTLIENRDQSPLYDVKATLWIKEYMDAPKQCSVESIVKPGEAQRIDLFALFKEKVLEITESTKVSVQIDVEYMYKEEKYTLSSVETVRVLDRNAMSWDDNRKASAFVTAKDPAVLSFSKNVGAAIEGIGPVTMDKNLLAAMSLHETLSQYGMNYSPDPTRSYVEMSKQKQAIDYLQFPRQTLEYRAGDCDDLSILYCALLESVGIQTGFITVPGHIYMAFALDMTPEEAKSTFLRPEDLIFSFGKAWVPFEVTETRSGFLTAWQKGAQEWRENMPKGQAAFYQLSEAWKEYESVGLPGSSPAIKLPDDKAIAARYQKELALFVDREVSARAAQIQDEIRKSKSNPKAVNKLGILYAKYGLYDKAKTEFQKLVGDDEYPPALINLGNIYLILGDAPRAVSFFTRAFNKNPTVDSVVLGLARAQYLKGDYQQAQKTWDLLYKNAPDLAERYSYLGKGSGEASRAGQAAVAAGRALWSED
jgi:tetratricopeptide (TPR) repeat protein